MGPGHGGPGEFTIKITGTSSYSASMGPGHGGPGESMSTKGCAWESTLQWGRATEGPESWHQHQARQYCHRFNGAGPRRARRVRPRVPSSSRKPGFNGAGPRRARREHQSR